MYVIADNPTSGSFLWISPVMRSYPGAFVEGSLLIATLTSVTVNLHKKTETEFLIDIGKNTLKPFHALGIYTKKRGH
jgi:hypothetical protein